MGPSASGHDNGATHRSRRALLAGGAVGALGAIAFETLGNAPQAQAQTSLPGGVFTSGFAPAAVTLHQSGGSVTVDASQGNVFTLSLTASGWKIANPINPVGDGQLIRIRLSQDTTGGRTLSWGSAYDFGSTGGTANSAPLLSTTASGTDILGFEYVAALSRWCYLGASFPQAYGNINNFDTTISVVQSAFFAFNTEGNFTKNVTAGNSIVLIPALYAPYGTNGSFSTSNPQFGSKGNYVSGTELVQGIGTPQSPGYGYTALWLLPNVAGGKTYVRVEETCPDSGGPLGTFAYEVAGLGPTPQLDSAGGLSSAVGVSAQLDSGACPAIAQAPEIIFGYGHIYAVTLSGPSAAWTSMSNGGTNNFWAGYRLAATPGGSYDWSQAADDSGSWGAAVVAISP